MTKIPRAEEARHNSELLAISDREAAFNHLLKWAEDKIPLAKERYIYTHIQHEKINSHDGVKMFEKYMIDLGYEVDIDYDLNSWTYGAIHIRW